VAADAIVNSANPLPIYAGAVDRSIYLAAGPRKLLAEREKIGTIEVGSAAYTPAFALPAKYIIHTVGPSWVDGEHGEVDALHSCYKESLKLAESLGCQSIAFPIISSGAYRFPKDLALQAAISEISSFLLHHSMDIYLVVYDQDALHFSYQLFHDIQEFIDENYVDDREQEALNAASNGDMTVSGSLVSKGTSQGIISPAVLDRINTYREELHSKYAVLEKSNASHGPVSPIDLEKISRTEEENFGEYLCSLIAEKGKKNSEVYQDAGISKQAFSQIKYSKKPPLRSTVAGFAVALHLTEAEAEILFEKAGYSLSKTQKFDLVVRYFLQNPQFSVYDANDALEKYGLPLLGSNRNLN
jgi:O-acetyl-ADP-ribose deacetylase (regulator of RNase III)